MKSRVDRFVGAFERYIDQVGGVRLGEGDERYRKLLYFSILEGLAKARYPSKRAGSAFSSLVANCGRWPDCELVSLPHLAALLERTSDPRFDALRAHTVSAFSGWGSGGPLPIARDLGKSAVQQLWPVKGDGSSPVKSLGLRWMDLQHRSLLYSYRSKLVHEAREPTSGVEGPLADEPFYESVGRLCADQVVVQEWHLVYPSEFLHKLCATTLENLKSHMEAERKDPYESFQFGCYLLDVLNEPI